MVLRRLLTMHMFLWLSIISFEVRALANNPQKSTTRQPNIIIVLTDDLGYGDLSINGNTSIQTPHIDQMAREGIQFSNFFASANVCTPSRAGLLTGRYPIRTGLAHKAISAEHTHGLPQSELTIAELLKEQGYRTAIIGKWHLGHSAEHWPTEHGFDYYWGLPFSNDMTPLALYQGSEKIEEPVDQTTLTERYTAETIRFMEENQETPFFIYLPHTFPHIPLHVSERFEGQSQAGLYGDVIETLDWSMGEIFAALKRLDIDQNTLVMFTSDNGAWFEGSNSSSRGAKGSTWNGGYRVPFIARWPEGIKSNQRTDAISMNFDLLPTIAEITATEVDASIQWDGKSIVSLFQGSNVSPHDHLLFFADEDIAAIRTQKWKLQVRDYFRGNFIAFDRIEESMGFAYTPLFDMTQDHSERYSAAREHPEVVDQLMIIANERRKEFDPLRTQPAPKTTP